MSAARESARHALMCEGFARYFNMRFSKYVLNIDRSEVTARPLKGQKRKVVLLTWCQTSRVSRCQRCHTCLYSGYCV
jgi:hypothetical protein